MIAKETLSREGIVDIGTGIAVVGAWIFPAACALSRTVSGIGVLVAIICAFIVTAIIL